MVKFSKELNAQLIPEWKEAFVNYWQLKKHIKRIRLSRKSKPYSSYGQTEGFSIFNPIRSVINTISSKFRINNQQSPVHQEMMSKVVVQLEEDEVDKDDDSDELLQLFTEEDEVRRFFERLDEELEKVNDFYKIKETEFCERGEALAKQLDILLQLKKIFGHRRRKQQQRNLSNQGISESLCSTPSSQNSDYSRESSTNGHESSSDTTTDELLATLQKNGILVSGSPTSQSKLAKGSGRPKMAMRVDVPALASARSMSVAMSGMWEDLLNNPRKDVTGDDIVNRKKIQCAEKMIRGAFIEFYRGLRLLNTYRSLNMVAFTKILKKFDKVANQQTSADYLKQVRETHFITSHKVGTLMDEVETLFTQHFADNDRKMAMKLLKPQQQKDSHVITFFVGLFTGSFVCLFVLYAILAHFSGIFSRGGHADYMEIIYPVFSIFALMSVHLFMYGCNLVMWKATRINYNFIFEFSPKTSLKARDAFLICTSIMTAVIGSMVIHLVLKSKGFSPSQVDGLLGILMLTSIGLLFCPFNILYRPTRYFFLRVIRNIVCCPLYKVMLVDFFMADQLTSQILLLRHMETTACYFMASFRTQQYQACKSGKLYTQLAYLISFAPYYWRAMQCARRWFDKSDPDHLANLGKYVSAMVAAGARLTYAQQPTPLLMIIVLLTSVAATIYQLYWDFVKDWGLLNPNSKNPWLRDELILKKRCIYYISIAVNVVLRVVWVESVMRFNLGIFESRLLEFSLASLEVIRRGHWNFYRLENEHLNNVGKFRAVKKVPLPFREIDSDG
ncbi:hypothetical protein Drorol1_Dr00000963 [Drosera rotundifolia]